MQEPLCVRVFFLIGLIQYQCLAKCMDPSSWHTPVSQEEVNTRDVCQVRGWLRFNQCAPLEDRQMDGHGNYEAEISAGYNYSWWSPTADS